MNIMQRLGEYDPRSETGRIDWRVALGVGVVLLGAQTLGSAAGAVPNIFSDFMDGYRHGADTGEIMSPAELDPYGAVDATIASAGAVANSLTGTEVVPVPTTEPVVLPTPIPLGD